MYNKFRSKLMICIYHVDFDFTIQFINIILSAMYTIVLFSHVT